MGLHSQTFAKSYSFINPEPRPHGAQIQTPSGMELGNSTWFFSSPLGKMRPDEALGIPMGPLNDRDTVNTPLSQAVRCRACGLVKDCN